MTIQDAIRIVVDTTYLSSPVHGLSNKQIDACHKLEEIFRLGDRETGSEEEA